MNAAVERLPESDEAGFARNLVERIAAGDRSAEALLVARYRDQIVMTLRRHGRTEDAEDLAHDALITLLEKLRTGSIAEPEKLGAYLSGIAVNLSIAVVRKEARRKTRPEPALVEQAIDSTPSVPDAVGDAECLACVVALLHDLNVGRDTAVLLWALANPDASVADALTDELRRTRLDLSLGPMVLRRVYARLEVAQAEALFARFCAAGNGSLDFSGIFKLISESRL